MKPETSLMHETSLSSGARSSDTRSSGTRMKVVYFAWLRERVQRADEEIAFPAAVVTVADALAHLATLGENYAYAFEKPEIIRAALDKKHVKPDTLIAGAREIAFFPPMTGG